jgi:hypothetical protein
MVGKGEFRKYNKKKSHNGPSLTPCPHTGESEQGEPFQATFPFPPLRTGKEEERADRYLR